jgi:Integrase core domain
MSTHQNPEVYNEISDNYGTEFEDPSDCQNDLENNYTTPGHPIAFSGITNIYKFYKGKLSIDKIKEILSSIENYTLHREYKKGQRNPSYSHFKRYQFQMDLVDIQELAEYNDGVRYIMTVIDTFTRFAFCRLLLDKKAETVLSAFKSVLKEAKQNPNILVVDRGAEFQNKLFTQFCSDNNIKIYTPDSSIHAAFIERFNRTLQSLIYKFMTENETYRFISQRSKIGGEDIKTFSRIVNSYNNRRHRMIGTTPLIAETNPDSHTDIRLRMSKEQEKIKRKKQTFKIGDTVRIAIQKGKFSRGYKEQSNLEIFRIYSIKTSSKIPMYFLETYDKSEKIKGGFYDFELTKVSGDVFRIEKILKTRKVNGITQHFVRWKGFNSNYDSWINADDITNEFD